MATVAPSTVPPSANKKTIVKQVNAGDQIVLFVFERNPSGPPPEITVTFSNIAAPKLGKVARPNFEATQDEPYAWEAREFLRKKLVGEVVTYKADPNPAAAGNKEYGVIFLGQENITELLVAEGYAKVREGRASEERSRLLELQEKAKLAKKNIWDDVSASQHVRNIKGNPDNLTKFVDQHGKKPIKALIEHVHDGSKFRAVLLPEFHHITLMLTGIRCPPVKSESGENDDIGLEAKFYVEMRILQRDIEVILESAVSSAFYGTILHPKGNIAEVLLKAGLAQCVDWSMSALKSGVSQLRSAEKYAKENKLKIWRNHQSTQPTLTGKEKEFQGTVVEVVNGDALMVKVGDQVRKIFLSSIRPPRDTPKTGEEGKPDGPVTKTKIARPLYDIPYLFEAREFLRKKLIGKKVQVTVDYIQPKSEQFPEKTCCTVKIGGVNVAEALVMKGLATVLGHKQNDDARSSQYDALKAAEEKARKSGKGLYGKKDAPGLRVTDVSADAARARTFLSSLQRIGRVEAVVEFVHSGSRLRLYIPKESCIATFLLAGINCPRANRAGGPPGEPFGDEALRFTRDRTMQREVEISVDGTDKGGSFIGWLWIEGQNLSVALVEEGLASVHYSAEKSEYYRALKLAEDAAKARKDKIWENYVQEEKPEEKIEEETTPDRTVNYQSVVVTEVTQELKVFVQSVDQGPKLETLMTQIRQQFQSDPPLPGAYTPRKGDLCAAKFAADGEWYRARVERIQGAQVHVLYIDYGNREVTAAVRCAALPPAFTTDKPYANEFSLAYVKFPPDIEDQEAAVKALREEVLEVTLLLNVEYKIEKTAYVTLTNSESKVDIGKWLVSEAYLMVDPRREKRLQKIVSEYKAAQDEAKKAHKGIWQYGDITEDDAKEFGR